MAAFRWSSILPPAAIHVARAIRSRDERHDVVYEYGRRLRGEPPLPTEPIERVVVLCYGNICRSPFAGLDLARQNPKLQVRTAGLFATEGKPPEPGALRIATEHGIDLSSHAAHLLDESDVAWADLLIGMQGRHVSTIADRWPEAREKTRLLGDYASDAPYWIEDPWGFPDDYFREVFAQIVAANRNLNARIEAVR